MAPVRVHDLLGLRDAGALQWEQAPPSWLAGAPAGAAWVVARRSAPDTGRIVVGVRGHGREQRAAAWVDAEAVRCVSPPESLRGRILEQSAQRAGMPVFRALAQLEQAWASEALPSWGPAGSVGFELASGCTAATPDSDLDIVVRCTGEPGVHSARRWLHALPRQPLARIDVLLEWDEGGASLHEYAAGGDYLLRTPQGAQLRRRAARVA